jgi:hypothetical protein
MGGEGGVEKPRSSEEVVYERLRQIADAYLSVLDAFTAASKRRALTLAAARLALALLLAGLPMTAASSFKPVRRGGLYAVEVRKPRGAVHLHYLTPEEVGEISALLNQLAGLKPVSGGSLVRVLQRAAWEFRASTGLAVTYRDVYAIKACALGLKPPYRYSRKRLEQVAASIDSAYRRMRVWLHALRA